MCVPIHQRDPKTRRMMVAGNISLVLALLIWNFVRPAGVISQARWVDGLTGLLFGISIGANLWALRCARRRQPPAGWQL